MIEEWEQLDEKISKLARRMDTVMFHKYPHVEQDRMEMQIAAMKLYSYILRRRIRVFANV